MPRNLPRRYFIALVAVAPAALALASCSLKPVTFKEAVADYSKRRPYLERLKDEEPQLRAALKEGSLSDIVDFPDDTSRLVELMKPIFRPIALVVNPNFKGSEVDNAVNSLASAYVSSLKLDEGIVGIVPYAAAISLSGNPIPTVIGRKIPHPMIIDEKAWGNASVRSDADFRTLVSHYLLSFVNDYYGGLAIKGLAKPINGDDIAYGRVRSSWFEMFADIRAYHKAIVHIARNKPGVSAEFQDSALSGYIPRNIALGVCASYFNGTMSLRQVSDFLQIYRQIGDAELKQMLEATSLERAMAMRQMDALSDLVLNESYSGVIYKGTSPPTQLLLSASDMKS
jgi:hypothetical protein